jgi:phage recombination protein Bet
MTETALVPTNGAPLAPAPQFDERAVSLIKQQIMGGKGQDLELRYFLAVCCRTGLDPFTGQIFAVFRKDRKTDREVMQIQIGIDGLRSLAARTGELDGTVGPYWCGDDGVWKDVWLADVPPAAAKVGVLRRGCREPFWGIATYRSFVQTYYDRQRDQRLPIGLWETMPDNQLAKCAEAQALRRAFPREASEIEGVPAVDLETGEVREEQRPAPRQQQRQDAPRASSPSSQRAPAPPPATDAAPGPCADCGKQLTAGQSRLSRQKFGGLDLCPEHQKQRADAPAEPEAEEGELVPDEQPPADDPFRDQVTGAMEQSASYGAALGL